LVTKGPKMLTHNMKRVIEEQRLGLVATAVLDGTPNVSPKGTFVVLHDRTIAFGEIRSPGTITSRARTLLSSASYAPAPSVSRANLQRAVARIFLNAVV
jgi:hypothetical protein